MSKLIYWLKEIQQSDSAVVGGKAANLGDLARGLNVPAGFCLSCAAYSANLQHFGIEDKIREQIKGLSLNNLESVDKVSAGISRLIMETGLLPEIENAVSEALEVLYKGREGIKVAVRSSATAEDLVGASFAGLQETFLNVEGKEQVFEAVRKCWTSLWTPRAIHYRTQKGFPHEQVRMAVIIQEMVPAVVSGVMFTANPVNNSREEIRIEAVRGLGESLVSGQASGDVYIYKKNDVNVDLVSKSISEPDRGQMVNDYDLRELAHTGLKVELFYGDYQDIEWAYYQGKFYFLQTRPITTLCDEALPDIDFDRMNVCQKEVMDWIAERFPDPIYPIDGIIVKVLFLAQFEAMRSYGFKISEMDWTRVERGIFPEFFKPPVIKPGIKRFWKFIRTGKILGSDPAGEWAAEQVYFDDMLRKLRGRDISGLPFELVLDYITEALHHLHYFTVMRYKYFAENKISGTILFRFLRMNFKEKAVSVYEDLLAGSENMTMEINRALKSLVDKVAGWQEVKEVLINAPLDKVWVTLEETRGGDEFLDELRKFLDRYGERETTMGLGGVASPTWQDSPEVVFGIIRGMLCEGHGAGEAVESSRRKRVKEAEELLESCFEKGIWRFSGLKPFIMKTVRHARSFVAFRENSHYDMTRALHVFRILFTELGRRFVRQGILDNPRDIFYLSYFETREIINTIFWGLEDVNVRELAARIQSRKDEQERRMVRWANRKVVYDGKGALKGIPSGHGVASGPVRVIRDPGDFHRIRKGDIIVAPYTNPAWTPLFTTAAGLVVETGGAASHAAIIAREYGIPAVMGVVKATKLVNEGEIITVNGSTGIVYRQESAPG
ncbi:MAG: hypothetical protein CVU89_14355 [Firmicutes bacterium HGW-Firmicutes-14]|nr:MAG: hypothetical protein CVU89_14355 [Firmicutes bacterium HGW-Firmicutes-14]